MYTHVHRCYLTVLTNAGGLTLHTLDTAWLLHMQVNIAQQLRNTSRITSVQWSHACRRVGGVLAVGTSTGHVLWVTHVCTCMCDVCVVCRKHALPYSISSAYTSRDM